jgi:ligand-binding sensor domain-containing protein
MNSKIITLFTACFTLLGSSLQAQTFTNYTMSDGLLADNVLSLDVAANGDLWFGTQNGVSVFDGVSIWTDHTTTTDTGLAHNTIQALAVMSTGDVWIGTDFGVSVYNGSVWTKYTEANGLGDDKVKYIAEDLAGNIWFATSDGASMFDGVNWTNYGMADGLPFGGANHITVHSNGDIWISTGLGGVAIWDGATFTEITENEGLLNDKVRSLVIDGSGNKWVGTADGISVFDNSNTFSMNHTTMFTLPPPDTLNPVEDMAMDSQGIIWTAVYVDYLVTEGGVCAYDGANWFDYDVSDGLVGPVVRRLTIDANDDVWVATSTGVSKISNTGVGIESVSDNASFNLYPNPTSDVLNISLTNVENEQIEVYNTTMQLVKTVPVGNRQQQATMSMADVEHGIYFVKIGNQVSKVIVN